VAAQAQLLAAGSVVHYPMVFGIRQGEDPHNVVIVDCQEGYYFVFVIKSAPTAWQQKSENRMEHLVDIEKNGHPFLAYDSKVNCNQLHPIRIVDMSQYLQGKPSALRGTVTPIIRARIRGLVSTSSLLAEWEIEGVLNYLTL
jgi:hypothetical protein